MKKTILISFPDLLVGRAYGSSVDGEAGARGARQCDLEDVEEADDAVLQPVKEHDREQAPAEEENPEEGDHVDDYQKQGGYRQREHAAMITAPAYSVSRND